MPLAENRELIARKRSESLKLLISSIKCIDIDRNPMPRTGKCLIGQLAQTRVPYSHVRTASSPSVMPSITDHHLWSVCTLWSRFGMISTFGKLWEWFGQKCIFRFRARRPCSTPQPLQPVPASRTYLILCNTCIYDYFNHSLCVFHVCTYLIIIGVLLHFKYHYLAKRPAWSLFCCKFSVCVTFCVVNTCILLGMCSILGSWMLG